MYRSQVLISTLAQSKVTSNMIERKVKEAAKTQEIIAKTRTGYLPIAFRASQLFFCIADLGTVDPMYQVRLRSRRVAWKTTRLSIVQMHVSIHIRRTFSLKRFCCISLCMSGWYQSIRLSGSSACSRWPSTKHRRLPPLRIAYGV